METKGVSEITVPIWLKKVRCKGYQQ